MGAGQLTVTFADLSTNTPTSWAWDFGDGDTAAEQSPTHIYEKAGMYTVSLTASNTAGSDTKTSSHCITVTFVDVTLDSWALPSILACVGAGIVAGYPDGTYQPSNALTRDQMAVFIARGLAGGDENVPEPTVAPGFTDVDSGHWAYRYICYVVDQNVAAGYPEGDYRPDKPVTRDEMAVYVARAMVAPTTSVLDTYEPVDPRNFPDVATDHWAYPYVEYCVENGVVGGYLDGTYRPDMVVNRAQMAVYVARAFGLIT